MSYLVSFCSCVFLFFFLSPFSIAITSLVEERAKLSAFRTFVRFLPVWICRFPLPLSVWEELRFVIVTLLGLFSYLFFQFDQAPGLPNCTISQKHLTTVDFFFFFFFFTYTTHIINRHQNNTTLHTQFWRKSPHVGTVGELYWYITWLACSVNQFNTLSIYTQPNEENCVPVWRNCLPFQ